MNWVLPLGQLRRWASLRMNARHAQHYSSGLQHCPKPCLHDKPGAACAMGFFVPEMIRMLRLQNILQSKHYLVLFKQYLLSFKHNELRFLLSCDDRPVSSDVSNAGHCSHPGSWHRGFANGLGNTVPANEQVYLCDYARRALRASAGDIRFRGNKCFLSVGGERTCALLQMRL